MTQIGKKIEICISELELGGFPRFKFLHICRFYNRKRERHGKTVTCDHFFDADQIKFLGENVVI